MRALYFRPTPHNEVAALYPTSRGRSLCGAVAHVDGTAPEQRASGSSGVGLPAGRSQGGSDDDLFMGRQVSTLPNLPSANCHSVRSVPLRITQMDGTVPFRGRNPLLAKSTQPQKTMFLGFQTMKPCPAERDTLNTRPKTSCHLPAALNYIVRCFLSAQL